MKHFVCSFLLLAVLSVSAQEKKFVVNGSIPSSSKKYKVLLSWDNGSSAEEANLVNGKFEIKGTITEPVIATISLQEENPPKNKVFDNEEFNRNNLWLFLDTGNISIISKTFLSEAVVNGTSTVNDFYSYQQQIKKIAELENKTVNVYNEYSKAKNAEATNLLLDVYKKLQSLLYNEQMAFVKKNPSSLVSLFLVQDALGADMDAAKGEPMFALLSNTLQQSMQGIKIKAMIETGKKSMVGTAAADFTQPDANGHAVLLSSFKGKYLLVDFWASWCGPCRAESPNLVKAYEKYNGKGFQIFSVSLDESKDKWLKAVNDDHYNWTQVGDMKGWNNAAARQFGVQGIPFNMLLDPNGVIIARNLRGDELVKKLEEIFK